MSKIGKSTTSCAASEATAPPEPAKMPAKMVTHFLSEDATDIANMVGRFSDFREDAKPVSVCTAESGAVATALLKRPYYKKKACPWMEQAHDNGQQLYAWSRNQS